MFVRTLETACGKAGWQVHAYCLMRNHFHLVIETPQPTLVSGMKWLMGTYTQRFNARNRQRGHVFAGRYKALLVDGRNGFYFRTVSDYVHLNPVRANLIGDKEELKTFRWSSFPQYLRTPEERPAWLRADRLMGEHGIQRDDARGRREFERRMEARRAEPEAEENGEIRRGWRFGAEDFLDQLADKMKPGVRGSHAADQVGESMRVKARRVLDEALSEAGLNDDDLMRMRKGAAFKIEVAARLRAETTLTLPEVAKLLHAGSWRSLANALSVRRRRGPEWGVQ